MSKEVFLVTYLVRESFKMFFNKKNNQDELKKLAATEAAKSITTEITLGVGTGSTVGFLIEELVNYRDKIKTVVSSSEDSTRKLKALGFDVVDLNYAGEIDLYIDGADECNNHKELIKGGGAALTREKICVAAA
ncbi:ribose-5-phosphate isomerase A, partial [Salmonella enterica]